MDLVSLNHVRMTRTTPEPISLSSNFRSRPARGHLTLYRFNVHQTRIHGGSFMESGVESTTLQYRSRGYRGPGLKVRKSYHGPWWPGLGFKAGRFQVRNSIPLKIRRVWDLLHVESYVVTKRHPAGEVQKF
ncbi:hypothetical protein AVEN_100806-1 [Araneus ventricosus]|uniref:Uncharacterized protein n=1 Tax=Araneus ventricosus TaxID=182803 RepID=A0A4Y2AYH2_ARAVE|nr:hypothetical protein AVEN_100806-1 [Araneus ventricosus]